MSKLTACMHRMICRCVTPAAKFNKLMLQRCVHTTLLCKILCGEKQYKRRGPFIWVTHQYYELNSCKEFMRLTRLFTVCLHLILLLSSVSVTPCHLPRTDVKPLVLLSDIYIFLPLSYFFFKKRRKLYAWYIYNGITAALRRPIKLGAWAMPSANYTCSRVPNLILLCVCFYLPAVFRTNKKITYPVAMNPNAFDGSHS